MSENLSPVRAGRWRVVWLLICHGAAVLLWLSLEASLWAGLDVWAFQAMNGMLAWGEGWQVLWAQMNTKAYDVVNGAIMVLFAGWVFLLDRAAPLPRRLAAFGVLCVAVLAGVALSKELFVAAEKLSPSLVVAPFYNLAELMPGIDAKTGSDQSFPADHGVVSFIYTGFILLMAKRRFGLIALVIAFFNVMPRMVSGAHWLSDTIVGGGMFAFIILAWVLATPALVWAEGLCARVLALIGWKGSAS